MISKVETPKRAAHTIAWVTSYCFKTHTSNCVGVWVCACCVSEGRSKNVQQPLFNLSSCDRRFKERWVSTASLLELARLPIQAAGLSLICIKISTVLPSPVVISDKLFQTSSCWRTITAIYARSCLLVFRPRSLINPSLLPPVGSLVMHAWYIPLHHFLQALLNCFCPWPSQLICLSEISTYSFLEGHWPSCLSKSFFAHQFV